MKIQTFEREKKVVKILLIQINFYKVFKIQKMLHYEKKKNVNH